MRFKPDNVLYLLYNSLRLGTRKINFVDNRNYVKVMVKCKIHVRKRLRLNSLCRIDNQYRTVTCSKASRNLIVKIHMPRCVDKVENIFLSILCLIHNAHRLCLDCYASFSLKIHIIKHLCLHLTACEKSGFFNDSVRKRRLAVINMGYNTKITNFTLVYGHLIPHF